VLCTVRVYVTHILTMSDDRERRTKYSNWNQAVGMKKCWNRLCSGELKSAYSIITGRWSVQEIAKSISQWRELVHGHSNYQIGPNRCKSDQIGVTYYQIWTLRPQLQHCIRSTFSLYWIYEHWIYECRTDWTLLPIHMTIEMFEIKVTMKYNDGLGLKL